jgi:hypothetical protein
MKEGENQVICSGAMIGYVYTITWLQFITALIPPAPFSLRTKGEQDSSESPSPEGEGFRVRAKCTSTLFCGATDDCLLRK